MSEISRHQFSEPSPPEVLPARKPLGRGLVQTQRSRSEPRLPDAQAPDKVTLALTAKEPFAHLSLVLSYFILAYVSQVLLLFPQFAVLRLLLRMLPFGLSLALSLFPFRNRVGQKLHPALPLAIVICSIVTLGLFNQQTESVLAGIAQIGLTMAVLAPLLWVGRLQIGVRGFASILLCVWGFNTASAGLGVLQVMFPGHFEPALSSVVQGFENQGDDLKIQLADGSEMHRPMGLTDTPGGAAPAGMIAFLFGLGLLVSSRSLIMRSLYLVGMGIGLFVIYLSQVRVSLVMCGVATIAFLWIMSVRRELARVTGTMAALAVVVFVSTSAAFVVGGSQTRDRLFTLVDDNAETVYYNNRGVFLDYTFNYALPAYPFGAGLGRYGMTSYYFNNDAFGNHALWAEIQWTAWVYDGGCLMIVTYPLAILIALGVCFKIALNRGDGPIGLWAATLVGYTVSVIAVTFSYAFFLSQSGLEFWLLTAALYSATQWYQRLGQPIIPEGFEVLPAPWKPNAALAPDANPVASPGSASPRRRPLQSRPLPAVVPIFES